MFPGFFRGFYFVPIPLLYFEHLCFRYQFVLSFAIMDFEKQLQQLIKNALAEDMGDGDHSTLSSIDKDAEGKAILKIKENGILAGLYVAEKIFSYMQPNILFTAFKKDGDAMQYGETAFEVNAKVHTILQCERLVLNCMQRMSGIATLTHQYTKKLQPYKTRLLDTRKTTPNMRLFEKAAVLIGGGANHRMRLDDMMLIKDNHIEANGGIINTMEKLKKLGNKINVPVEIEVKDLEELGIVAESGKGIVDRVMLDNFPVEDVKRAVEICDGNFEIEVSGGISLDNISRYKKIKGVDFISSGALTHSVKSIDISLEFIT